MKKSLITKCLLAISFLLTTKAWSQVTVEQMYHQSMLNQQKLYVQAMRQIAVRDYYVQQDRAHAARMQMQRQQQYEYQVQMRRQAQLREQYYQEYLGHMQRQHMSKYR